MATKEHRCSSLVVGWKSNIPVVDTVSLNNTRFVVRPITYVSVDRRYESLPENWIKVRPDIVRLSKPLLLTASFMAIHSGFYVIIIPL